MSTALAVYSLEPAPDYSEGARHVESILTYFERQEKAVTLGRGANTQSTIWHLQECWLLVYEHFYGVYRLPSRPMPEIITAERNLKPITEKPKWMKEHFANPLRHVSGRRLVRGVVVLDLSCGHSFQDLGATMDGDMPKRRRCKKCKPESGKKRKA